MKKILSLLVAVFAISVGLNAQTIVIDDGFENGILDSLWTQEFVVGQTPWVVEDLNDGLEYPASVVQGTKRLSLRNRTGETEGYVTRLVSKVMDLSEVYQPYLAFYYANPKWTTDRDTLRIYYRTGEKSQWQLLQEFSSASADWQKVSVSLPEYNKTYQIAFEGKDNLGRGIVLDSVKLRSAPECTVPHDLAVTATGTGTATLSWLASWDANSYDLIICTEKIDPDTISRVDPKKVAYNVSVPGLQQNYNVTLTSGEYYNVYVRSICDAENSMWSSSEKEFRFRMKATKELPYSYDFNMEYTAGYVKRDVEWTWGCSEGGTRPFISTHLNSSECKPYSNDGTIHLTFAGAKNGAVSNTTPLPAGEYGYVATPGLMDTDIVDFNLKDYEVRFWSTVASYTGRTYARSIIIGVMDNPEDITTFVPVDTVSVWGTSTFVENAVSLENYVGTGVYVAFLSNFDTRNLFYIDNMTISRREGLRKVTGVYVNPRDTFATISWPNVDADSYNLIISNADKEVVAMQDADKVLEVSNIVGTQYVATNLEAGHNIDRPYYVYVQAVKNGQASEWSYRAPFYTMSKAAVPQLHAMEQDANTIQYKGSKYPGLLGIYSNAPQAPYLSANSGKTGMSLYLVMDQGNDSWITLPMVDTANSSVKTLQEMELIFYMKADASRASVGVMSNPQDINTFEEIASFTGASAGYQRCYTNFTTYQGKGDVVAIRWIDRENGQTTNYIDDVVLEPLSKCVSPASVMVSATDSSAVLKWAAGDLNRWQVVVSNQRVDENTINADDDTKWMGLECIMIIDTVEVDLSTDTAQFNIDSLQWGKSYYYYIRSLCSPAGDERSWFGEGAFATNCPEKAKIPFVEDCENMVGQNFGCWSYVNFGTNKTYPKIMTTAHTGGKSIEMWSSALTTPSYRDLLVAPSLEGSLSDYSLSFWARPYSSTASAKAYLVVGMTSNPQDKRAFVALDTIELRDGTQFQKYAIDLVRYSQYSGNIAFTAGLTDTLLYTSDLYIDDISFQSKVCKAPFNIMAVDETETSMRLTWEGISTDKWEIRMSKKFIDIESSLFDSISLKDAFFKDTVDKDVYYVDVNGLSTYTKYYAYIRPTCGDSIWACDSVYTGCFKLNPNKANKETFDGEEYQDVTTSSYTQPICWRVGNELSTSTSYVPYIYPSTTYSANNSPNSLKLYGYVYSTTSNYAPAYAITPEVDIDSLQNTIVTFNMYASTSNAVLFGVISDPYDLNTMVVLDSIVGSGKSAVYSYDMFDYASEIPADAHYIIWRTPIGATSTAYLDDISVVSAACPNPKPSISQITDSSFVMASGLRVSNPWALMRLKKDINADSLNKETYQLHDTMIVSVDTIIKRSSLVEGLEENTEYYYALKTICEEGGQWVRINVTTLCKAKPLSEFKKIGFEKDEGFDFGSGVAIDCWTTGNKQSTSSSYIPYINEISSTAHSGSRYLYFYSLVSTTKADGAYAIMPAVDIDSITRLQVRFYARFTSTAAYPKKLIVGVVTDPSDLSTFVAVDTISAGPTPTVYNPYIVNFDTYEGDYMGHYGKYVAFMSEFGVTNQAYIDDITLDYIPSCPYAQNVRVDSVGDNRVMLSWNGESDQYRVMIAEKEVEDTIRESYDKYIVDTLVNTSDSVWISGLEGGKIYYAYLQSVCGEQRGRIFMDGVKFITLCPIDGYVAPYENNFDKNSATGTTVKPDCWDGAFFYADTLYKTQTYPYVYASSSYAYNKSKACLYLYSSSGTTMLSSTYAVAPIVQGDISQYVLSFYGRRSNATATTYGKKLQIGYVLDGTPQDSIKNHFILLDSIDIENASYDYYELPLTGKVVPANARITLRADYRVQEGLTATTKYATFYIDNFRIGKPLSCFEPSIAFNKSTTTTAELTITRNVKDSTSTQWQVAVIADTVYQKIKDDASELLQNEDPKFTYIMVDTLMPTISGLTSGTKYDVFVRTVCGEKEQSNWSSLPADFYTKYTYKDSYFFGFETKEGEVPNISGATNYIHPAIEVGYLGGTATTTSTYYPRNQANTSSYLYSYTDDGALYLNATSTTYGAYTIFPSIEQASTSSFSFKARQCYISKSTNKPSSSYAASFEVGYVDQGKGMETYQQMCQFNLEALKTTVVATKDNDYLFSTYSFDLDSAIVKDKQLVIWQKNTASYQYLCIDDVRLSGAKGYGCVAMNPVKNITDSSAVISWQNISGPWNVYVLHYNANTKRNDTIARYENTNLTSLELTGLQEHDEYVVWLYSANAPKGIKMETSSSVSFRTCCKTLEPDEKGEFSWDFDSDYDRGYVLPGTDCDSLYYVPSCWINGTTTASTSATGNQWVIQRPGWSYTSAFTAKYNATYAKYEYGRLKGGKGTNALRVYSTKATMTPYIILPALHCSYDTMMVEFWGRCLCNYASDHGTPANQNKMVSASYCGSTYNQQLVIGTVDDPTDISTLQIIDTITYTKYTSTTAILVTNDQSGERYWQNFKVPLSKAKGKYIVLFQPETGKTGGLFFVDDLSVRSMTGTMFDPKNPRTSDITETGATLSWEVQHPTLESKVVMLSDEVNAVPDTITLVGTELKLNTLSPATVYKWYMYQVSADGSVETQHTATQSFITNCYSVDVNELTMGFENKDGVGWRVAEGQSSEDYKWTKCWTYGNAGTTKTWSTSQAYNLPNTASALYSLSGEDCVKLYAYGSTFQTYIATPEVDPKAYDTLQINFSLNAVYRNASNEVSSITYIGATYAKSVIVGTMTDPNDPSTFVAIDTINYTNVDIKTKDACSEENNYLYQTAKVGLRGAKGNYVALMATLTPKGGKKLTYDYIYIDDISFSKLQECTDPYDVVVTDTKKDGASFAWEGCELSEKYVIQVAIDASFDVDTAIVVNDTIDASLLRTYDVVGLLKPYTKYGVRVKSICGEQGASDFSDNVLFMTQRVPFFLEDFREATLESDWRVNATNPATLVFDSTDVQYTYSTSNTYAWKRITTNVGTKLIGAHYAVPFYTSSSTTTTYRYYALMTPAIVLDDVKVAHLTFDFALTQCSSYTPNANPAQEANMKDDYTFVVALSVDGGKTWKKENILGAWNNTLPEGQQLRDIPATGATARFDLSKYVGQTIAIAFYREAITYISTNCAIHLGNVRVNYFDELTTDTTLCQYQDIETKQFKIDGDSVKAGLNTYRSLQKAGEKDAQSGALDTLYILNADYLAVPETLLADTICDGESYSGFDFKPKTKTGVYRRKLQAENACDSLVTLNLYVAPKRLEESEVEFFCKGDTFTWQGYQLTRQGIYYDTLLTSLGCDSIISLNLQYYADEDTIIEKSTIFDTELPFEYKDYTYIPGQKPIQYPVGTPVGTYMDTVYVVGQNCTAVLVHTLVIQEFTGLSDVMTDEESTRKFVKDDHLYIRHEKQLYDATGKKVDKPKK